MLPPVLRNDLLIALIKVIAVPLQYVYNQFVSLKTIADNMLNITGNVQYLEKALNDAFYLNNNQIYIDTPAESYNRILYLESEGQTSLTAYMESENKSLLLFSSVESTVKYNFTVHVPTSLCTSLDKNVDIYKGLNYQRIINILNTYKPAGRTFSIELYNYE